MPQRGTAGPRTALARGLAVVAAALAGFGLVTAGTGAAQPGAASAPGTAAAVAACGSDGFCDGFEDQTGSAPGGRWQVSYPNCQGSGTAVVDTSTAHAGSRSIRITGTAGYCNHVFVGTALSTASKVHYGRFYVRHSTPLPSAHVTFLAMRDTSNSRDLRMGGQNQALQWNRESDDATLPEQSPNGVALSRPLPVNTWTCVEFVVDGNQGQLRTWVNGAEVAGLVVDGVPTQDVDGQWLRGATWRPALTDFRLGWESYGNGDDTLWFDDVAVSSTRIGC
ncbi:LamG-like jellyroll fold domain-containing protein [Goodfellowiella coeruleoviolacea]|nr:LamG-like jellyroll fold domain-containing protein [Goodfellowiella coeruleoviolacea]